MSPKRATPITEIKKPKKSKKAAGIQLPKNDVIQTRELPDFYKQPSDSSFLKEAMTFSRLLDPSLLLEEVLPFDKWIEDPYYSGSFAWEAWVGVKEAAQKIVTCADGGGTFFVVTGGIGTGKTTAAEIVAQYEAYKLLCHGNPALAAGLKSQGAIVIFGLFSTKLDKAKEVVYRRLRNNISASKWFREHHPFNERMLSRLEWPRLHIVPMPSTIQSAVSEDIFLAIVDEANLWHTSDQAENVEDVVNKLEGRMVSRFEVSPNVYNYRIIIASSGDTADSYTEKVKDKAHLYIAMTPWESRGEKHEYYFYVDLGDKFTAPRVIENETEAKKVIRIPLKYKAAYEADPITFLRDRVGLGVSGRRHLYSTSILHYPWLDNVNQEEYLLDSIPQLQLADSDEPRIIHVDIGLTQDWCGIACGFIKEANWEKKENGDVIEFVPRIKFDFVIRVRSPIEGGETDLDMVRQIIIKQVAEKEKKIIRITYDGFQSADSIQLLKKRGYDARRESIDKTSEPHNYLKRLFAEERVEAPYSSILIQELRYLFVDPKTGKIDHPKRIALENSNKTILGSKDIADSAAGVAWGAYNIVSGRVECNSYGESEIECRVFSMSRVPRPSMRF